MSSLSEEFDAFTKGFEGSPKYAVGDIIHIIKTDAHWLIEDIDRWEYCFRILDTDNIRRDSIFYIDGHNGIEKVA